MNPFCINCRFFRDLTGKDSKTIERANLMNVSKLLIKELIDSSLAHGRMLDDDYVPLQQFFVVLEHVLRHGLKRKLYAVILDWLLSSFFSSLVPLLKLVVVKLPCINSTYSHTFRCVSYFVLMVMMIFFFFIE